MHLDPNNERTPSNKKRLKLKDFHKRQILGKIVKNLFVFKAEKPRKEPHGSGSGGSNNVVGSFIYSLKELKKTFHPNRGWYKTRISKTFNKSQLPGKLILINGKYFRICG